MWLVPFLALIAASGGNALKQYAMKNCGKRAPGPFNSICINLARAVICVTVSVFFWIGTGMGTTNTLGYSSAVLGGLGNAVGLFSWILASGFIPMSLIEIFSTFGNLVAPMILAPYLFNGDGVSLLQWIGCALLVASVFTFIEPARERVARRSGSAGAVNLQENRRGSTAYVIIIVTLQTVSTGMATVFQKYYNFHVAAKGNGTMEYYNLISFCVVVLVFLLGFAFFALFRRERISNGSGRIALPYRSVWAFILMAGVGLYVAQYGAGIASELPSAVYFPLYKSAVMLETFILDTLVFKDRFTLRRLVGLVLVIVASVLVNV